MYKEPNVYSSYKKNNIGKTIYDIVLEYKPIKIVEIGVLDAYSTICMAQAIRDLNNGGLVYAYDLFGHYDYNSSTMKQVVNNAADHRVVQYVTVKMMGLEDWLKTPEEFDLMHLDVSNTGDIIELVYKTVAEWKNTGPILFEGGTEERDQVDWMIKYDKTPIFPLKDEIGYEILDDRFPGLSIIRES
jgi:hypothetical protein